MGYLLLGLSGLAAFLATAAGTTIGLVASAGLLGAGAGGALLGRVAVADVYPPERRGRAVVSDLAGPAERAGALGLTDLIAASSAGVGVLGSAVLLEVSDSPLVVLITVGFLALPVALLVPLRETAPGSWPLAARSASPAG